MEIRTSILRHSRGLQPVLFLLVILSCAAAAAVRDGNIDPANLGRGDWIYSMMDATNRLGGHIATVTNENSLMQWYRAQGIRYIVVKAATSDSLFSGCYAGPQFTSNLVRTAHNNGVLIFGYNRSYGSNVLGEIAVSDWVFQQGADGFVWDAEGEWETLTSNPWITNGPAQAWALCSGVRSRWPAKFLAHAPFPIISLHASFPYKEFGYWSDAVMPQVYHFSSTGIKRSSSASINWFDVNWHKWQDDLRSLPPATIDGTTIYWTNAIKPLAPMQDVYGVTGSLLCEGTSAAYPDKDVMEFLDYLAADPHAATPRGYHGASFWRADLHGAAQWAYIRGASAGDFSGSVTNIILDDAAAAVTGAWTSVRTFAATPTTPAFYGATGTDTNSFGTNYWSKGRGTGAAFMEFRPFIPIPGAYDLYQWHPYRADASTNIPVIVTHANGLSTLFANQRTNDGQWSLLGRFPFAAGTNATIRFSDAIAETNAVAMVDALKLTLALAAPRWQSVLLGPGQQVQLVASGDSETYSVEVSSNLVQWAPLATLRITNGSGQYVTPVDFGSGHVFYRLSTSP